MLWIAEDHSSLSIPPQLDRLVTRKFSGADRIDLLLYGAMISSLFTIGIWWHAIQNYPGLLEAIGYVYGILAASFTLDALDAYLRSDLD